MMHRISLCLAIAGIAGAMIHGFGAASSPAWGIERTVEFRDGTILRVAVPDEAIPWQKAARDGTVTREPLSWQRVDQLFFVDTPALEKLAEIKGLLAKLGSNKYLERVEAHKDLTEKGIHFRGVLEEVFKVTGDPEIRWRLDAVLKSLQTDSDAAPVQYNYDLVQLSGSNESVQGDAGDLQLAAKFRGQAVVVDRKNTCRVRSVAPPDAALAGGGLGAAEVIDTDKDELFPPNVTRINFDRGAAGELLVPGNDIKHTFISLGCTIHSAVKGSPDAFASVVEYNVKGRSGHLCAANHDPLYMGDIIVRFCLPGNASVPAGVHYVGCWTAYIEPQGTSLIAYDVHDRQIGMVKTRVVGNDFLALHSHTPIAYIKVVSDPEIDEDHAIDDLFFDPPVTLAEASDPKWTTVLLAAGERVKCRSFTRAADKVMLSELSVGIPRVEVPAGEVLAIMPPTETVKPPPAAGDCSVLLTDGSILRARGGKMLATPGGQAVPQDQLVALWGQGVSVTLPEDGAWPAKGALLVERPKTYKKLDDWTLGDRWVNAAGLELFDFTYADSPIIWFRRPAPPPAGAGIVRLASGEELVLSPAGYQLVDWSPAVITVKKNGTQTAIPFEQVLALRLPR